MDPATYIAAAGLKANYRALNIAANNLANINSPGFKSDSPFYRMLQASYGNLSGSTIAGTTTDFSMGSFRTTGNPLDLGLNGEGFFTIRTPAGIGYTRNGSFSIDTTGELVTTEGFQVLDSSGQPIPIILNPQATNEISVNPNGEISVDGNLVAILGVVRLDDLSTLQKLETQIFTSNVQGQQMVNPNVEQGVVEQSNANAISTLLDMVELQRAYDLNTKIVHTLMNQINRRATAEIVSGQ